VNQKKRGTALDINIMPIFFMPITIITSKNMKQLRANSTALSIIHFKTEWSAACQLMDMICRDVEKIYRGTVNFYSVDAERESPIAGEFGIMETPTLLLLKNNNVVDHVVGLTAKNKVIEKIENAIATLPHS
jgi:thioredoxin 1